MMSRQKFGTTILEAWLCALRRSEASSVRGGGALGVLGQLIPSAPLGN